jgi:hypothetical protein
MRPSVITGALKQKVNHIIRENRYFTISEVSRTVAYEIVTEHLLVKDMQMMRACSMLSWNG